MNTTGKINRVLGMVNDLERMISLRKTRISYYSIYDNILYRNVWTTDKVGVSSVPMPYFQAKDDDGMLIQLGYLLKGLSENLYFRLTDE